MRQLHKPEDSQHSHTVGTVMHSLWAGAASLAKSVWACLEKKGVTDRDIQR